MATGFTVVQNRGSNLPERRIVAELINTRNGEKKTYTVNKEKNIAEIQVSFSQVYGGLSKGAFRIYNLPKEITDKFTTQDFFANYEKRIKIYAGYEKRGETQTALPLIYDGVILWARLETSRPDAVFTIEAMEDFPSLNIDMENVVSFDYGGMSPISYIGLVLNKAGFQVDASKIQELPENRKSKYTKELKSIPAISGKIVDFLNSVSMRFNGMQWMQEKGAIYLLPNSEDQQFMLSQISEDSLKKQNKIISAKVSENPMGLMIGTPDISFYGVSLKCLYSEKLKPMEHFVLYSVLGGDAFNKVYEILSVDYDLQLRGQNFYQTITAIRYLPKGEGK